MTALFRMLTKCVCETPLFYVRKSFALSSAKKHVPFPQLRSMNVTFFGRNVEVAAEQNPSAPFVSFIKVRAKPSHPFQFESVLVRAYESPSRAVNVYTVN